MFQRSLSVLTGFCILSFAGLAEASACPKLFPMHIKNNCFRFETDLFYSEDAWDRCEDLGGSFAAITSPDGLKVLEKVVHKFISNKLKKAMFWVGLTLADDDTSTQLVADRDWKWDYDGSRIVQKDYTLWDKVGGPTDKSLACAVLKGSNSLVKAVDCDGQQHPALCMTDEAKSCRHGYVNYLMYEDHCIAVSNAAIEHKEIQEICHPNKAAPFTEEMRKFVSLAINNSFLGGGILMNILTDGYNYVDGTDYSIISDNIWEEEEPRNIYMRNYVGMSLQPDGTLKLKAVNADFMATSLCVVPASYEYYYSTEEDTV